MSVYDPAFSGFTPLHRVDANGGSTQLSDDRVLFLHGFRAQRAIRTFVSHHSSPVRAARVDRTVLLERSSDFFRAASIVESFRPSRPAATSTHGAYDVLATPHSLDRRFTISRALGLELFHTLKPK